MLSALRRGSASLARPFLSTSTHPARTRSLHAAQCHQTINPSSRSPFSVRTFTTLHSWQQQAAAARASEVDVDAELEGEIDARKRPSDARIHQTGNDGQVVLFEDLSKRNMVCKTVVDTLTRDMGLKTMTEVQSLTVSESLKGADILAQARTGTGKTLAFLIPTLQNIINYDPSLEHRIRGGNRASSTDIRAIIISPTRELAEQIAVEAKNLTRHTGVVVQTAVGGSSKARGLELIKRRGCHILVGTPGRLNDIMSDPYSRVQAPNLSALVLDEADRLLDQGFAPEIQAIQELLPDRRDVDRQTLLYSATVPQEVMQIVKKTMKPNFKFVQTVRAGESQTHERVMQKIVQVSGLENFMPALVELCQRELSKDGGRPFKAIVYFNATAEVSLASAIMQNLKRPLGPEENQLNRTHIIEMHAKLDQGRRDRAAERFRRASSAILLSSDVTARGMDFPNVTHVVQIGVPPSMEQYVHRIGRTARAGKEGEGWLFITNLENQLARTRLRGLRMQRDDTLETIKVDMSREAQLPEQAARILNLVNEASRLVPEGVKAAAYRANLGMYSWCPDKQLMVDAMNSRAKYGWGMTVPPTISPTLIGKLGLRRVHGIQTGHPDDGDNYGGEKRGSFRRGYGGQSSYQDGPIDENRGDLRRGQYRDRPGRQDRGTYDSQSLLGWIQDGSNDGYTRDLPYSGRGSSRGAYGDRDFGDRQRAPRRGLLPRGDMGELRGRSRY